MLDARALQAPSGCLSIGDSQSKRFFPLRTVRFDPDKHRDVRCPHGGSHQQDGLPSVGDTLLGARKPQDRFDRFQNFRRQHEASALGPR